MTFIVIIFNVYNAYLNSKIFSSVKNPNIFHFLYYLYIFYFNINLKKKWVFGHRFKKYTKIPQKTLKNPYFRPFYPNFSPFLLKFCGQIFFKKWAESGQSGQKVAIFTKILQKYYKNFFKKNIKSVRAHFCGQIFFKKWAERIC